MEFLRTIFKPLWLLREERFVIAPGQDVKPGTYIKLTIIPAPGFVMPPLLLSIGSSSYWVVLWLSTYSLVGAGPLDVLPTALLLGINSAARGSLKWRERTAAQASWHEPVGRERLGTRIAFGMIGAMVGFG